jgi:2-polyprenyl-6-methoxyphenol hydroxylase-like FAD-dependent oxidoreductase
MYSAAAALVKINPGSRVVVVKAPDLQRHDNVDEEKTGGKPSIILADGREIYADLVVGADGVKSVTRDSISHDQVTGLTTSSAYRWVVSASFQHRLMTLECDCTNRRDG